MFWFHQTPHLLPNLWDDFLNLGRWISSWWIFVGTLIKNLSLFWILNIRTIAFWIRKCKIINLVRVNRILKDPITVVSYWNIYKTTSNIKHNIYRLHDSISSHFVNTLSPTVTWVSEEETFIALGIELTKLFMIIIDIALPKYIKVTQVRFFTFPCIIWNLWYTLSNVDVIYDIISHVNSIDPLVFRIILGNQQHCCRFLKSHVLYFHNTILLWCFRSRKFKIYHDYHIN